MPINPGKYILDAPASADPTVRAGAPAGAVLKKILKFAAPYRYLFVLSLLTSLAGVVLGLIAPYLAGKAIDFMRGKGDVDYRAVAIIAGELGGLYIASALFGWASSVLTVALSQSTIKNIRAAFIKKLHSLPLSYLDQNSHGDILSRIINDLEIVSSGLLQGFIQLFGGVATISITIVMMYILNPIVASAIVLVSPVSILFSFFIAKRGQRLYKKQQASLGRMNGLAEELITNMKLVRAYGYEGTAVSRFDESNDAYRKAYKNAQFNSALINPTTRMINNAVYVIAGILGIAVRASIGDVGAFLMYSNQFTRPFNEVTSIIAELQSALAAAERVIAVLDEPAKETDKENAIPLIRAEGNVSFEHVKFSYRPDTPLIKDFSLEVKKGEKIAIVGPTGAGKTTLVNLLMRFYEIDGGSIKLDGRDIREFKRRDLRKAFGMVLQNTWLFSATVRENIAYGKDSATDPEIEEVARKCHSDEFINSMEKGYGAFVSDAGGNLSSGQRQLVSIARVMLTSPTMLILDEATSNIDTRTERYIQTAFDEMMKDKTSFIIAHRLSTIKNADKIVVLNNGDIIEIGNHEELLEKKGFYYNLYNSQFVE
jgi:ABC-type multidrug transport system, ATPase and permease components